MKITNIVEVPQGFVVSIEGQEDVKITEDHLVVGGDNVAEFETFYASTLEGLKVLSTVQKITLDVITGTFMGQPERKGDEIFYSKKLDIEVFFTLVEMYNAKPSQSLIDVLKSYLSTVYLPRFPELKTEAEQVLQWGATEAEGTPLKPAMDAAGLILPETDHPIVPTKLGEKYTLDGMPIQHVLEYEQRFDVERPACIWIMGELFTAA